MGLASALTTMGWLGNSTGWVASGSQAVKTARSGSVATLSYTAFIIGWIGDLMWLANGITVRSLQGMVSPLIPLAATLVIIYLFGRARGKSKFDSAKFPAVMFVSYISLFIFGVLDLYTLNYPPAPAGVTYGIAIAATISWMISSPMYVWRIIKMRSGRDVSLYMAGLTVLGQIFWVSYFAIRAWSYSTNIPLVDNGIANHMHLQDFLVSMISASFQIVMYSIMVGLKFFFAKKNGEKIQLNFFAKEEKIVELPTKDGKSTKVSKIKKLSVTAPIQGKVIDLTKAHDGVFSKGVSGAGVAIEVDQRIDKLTVGAPVSGQIAFMHHTKHTFGIKNKHGMSILVHCGTDKIKKNTKMFVSNVKAGDVVKAGDPIIEIDLATYRKDEIIEYIFVTNTSKDELSANTIKKVVPKGGEIFTLK